MARGDEEKIIRPGTWNSVMQRTIEPNKLNVMHFQLFVRGVCVYQQNVHCNKRIKQHIVSYEWQKGITSWIILISGVFVVVAFDYVFQILHHSCAILISHALGTSSIRMHCVYWSMRIPIGFFELSSGRRSYKLNRSSLESNFGKVCTTGIHAFWCDDNINDGTYIESCVFQGAFVTILFVHE